MANLWNFEKKIPIDYSKINKESTVPSGGVLEKCKCSLVEALRKWRDPQCKPEHKLFKMYENLKEVDKNSEKL